MAYQSKSKTSFFAALERLDDPDDTQDEEDSLENLLARSQSHKISQRTSAAPSTPVEPISFRRVNTEPQPSSADTDLAITGVTYISPSHRTGASTGSNMSTLKRAQTTGTMSSTKCGGPAAKKRRTESIKRVPPEQQIFKNLVFLFFPNNDVSPARRLRIQRAREYGAHWARVWSEDITHVVVDKGLLFQDVVTHLGITSFPTNVALVNETYPSDCIRFRSVLSPLQARFRVDGTPTATTNEEPTTEPEPSVPDSLPLKPSRREQRKSPETSQSSTGNSAPAGRPPEVVSEPIQEAAAAESRVPDTLDDIIQEAKAASHLPLDSLDLADEESHAEENDDESDSETGSPSKRRVPLRDRAGESWARNFACMQKFDPNAKRDNPNSRTIEILQQMLDYYTRMADPWRTLAYRKAINALRRQRQRIMTRGQALSIPGIGPRLADKIEEIVFTNHLRRLDHTDDTPEDRIIQEFIGIYGVGLPQATRWLAQGYRSLSDLRDKATLSKNQRIGLDHYDDFAQRIPRKEMEAHGAIVRQAVQAVDKDMQVIIAGSYRRGALNSGDVDLLITKPDATREQIRSLIINVVVPQLSKDGFLQASLATSGLNGDGSKWHGASVLPGKEVWRRIDLLFVPGAEIGAALLYFTGDDIFNRSMRLLARKKGMCLNQRGLYTDVLRRAGVKVNTGRLVEGRDERRIFAVLGVPWRPPEERICS